MPLFAFQIAQAFAHTKSKENYIFRLAAFSFISQIPFMLFCYSGSGDLAFALNIGVTFFIGALGMYAIEHCKSIFLKIPILGVLLAISHYVPMDYGMFGVLMTWIFYIFKDKKWCIIPAYLVLVFAYCITNNSLFELPAVISLIPILLYNGKKGRSMKYFFYAFYPVHMIILSAVKLFLLG